MATMAGGAALLSADLPAVSPLPETTLDTRASVLQSPAALKPLKTDRHADGRLYVHAKINGKRLRFMLDTGASHTVISAYDARRLGIPITGATRVRTAGGDVTARYGAVSRVDLGADSIKNQQVLVLDNIPTSLLGMDLLRTLEQTYIVL